MSTIQQILKEGTPEQLKAFFSFNKEDVNESVLLKFHLWTRKFFPKYFSSGDAPFHKDIDLYNLSMYRSNVKQLKFVDIAFRGAAKTARTKLFMAFCIANDKDHFRKYIKVLSEDGTNSTQIVTDVYNMLISPAVKEIWGEVFAKTNTKREETMSSFTTSTGVKMLSDTVGASGRGALQEEARPDLIWFEDFENRKTLRSNRVTKAIWDTMEEARTGIAKNGRCIYTCNYISEQGNVHKLVMQDNQTRILLIVPIWDEKEVPTWSRYTHAEIAQMKIDDEDFEGERLCKPSASKDVFFDREALDRQIPKQPKREVGGLKIFKEYNPSHRFGSGHDVAGGVGLDSSTSVVYDFDIFPAQVAATFANNTIKPDTFGDEIARESNIFGGCITAIEKNNHGHATIARARQLEVNQFVTPVNSAKVMPASQTTAAKEYGWLTSATTKNTILFAFAKAIEDGQVELNDENLIAECKAYTRNDLIETEKDPRLTTRHFDLMMAAAIGWRMRSESSITEPKEVEIEEEEQLTYPEIGM